MLKTEIEDDLGKNITEQEERITSNSDLLSTVTDGVARNEADVRDFEAKMAEQERRTVNLIGGVFSNLSGVLSEAVRKGVSLNEAHVAEQKEQMAVMKTKITWRMNVKSSMVHGAKLNSFDWRNLSLLSGKFSTFQNLVKSHYSKSQIFDQKFNFDEIPTFS